MKLDIDQLRIYFKNEGYEPIQHFNVKLRNYPHDSPWINDKKDKLFIFNVIGHANVIK